MSAEIAMIEEVKKHRCLYDYGMPEYNRKDITEEAWGQVGAALNLNIHECKDKWKNIRSSYVRSLKISKRSYYLAAYLSFLKPYIKKKYNNPHAESMQSNDGDEDAEQEDDDNESEKSDSNERFSVKVELEPTDPISDAEIYNDDDDDNEETASPPPPKKAKRRRETVLIPKAKMGKVDGDLRRKNARISDSNAMRYFLLSLLPEFETMDIEQVRIFKIKVMMLIDDIKGDVDQARQSLPRSNSDSERLQKRLINLLLKNLERP